MSKGKYLPPDRDPGDDCSLTYLLGEESKVLNGFRLFRDRFLRQMPGDIGEKLVSLYYEKSPDVIGFLKNMGINGAQPEYAPVGIENRLYK